MSGGFIPYHLRQNKAVDRAVFIELLKKIDPIYPIYESKYVGFAGPFLEDFKIIHANFGNEDLISIEMDGEVVKRQSFNQPLSCIEINEMSSGDFISQVRQDEERYTFWLDYASPRSIRDQIHEYGNFLSKAAEGSIGRLTLNVSPHALNNETHIFENGQKIHLDKEQKQIKRFEKVCSRLSDFDIKDKFSPEYMTEEKYPILLQDIIRRSCQEKIGSRNLVIKPLTSFVYRDGEHQMWTFTSILLPKDSDLLEVTKIHEWKYSQTSWTGAPTFIDMPDLSFRERAKIDQLLPGKDKDEVIKEIGYKLDDRSALHERKIKSYIDFYRFLPFYGRVTI